MFIKQQQLQKNHKKWDSKAIELGSSLVLKAYSSHKEMAGNGLAQGQVSLSMT